MELKVSPREAHKLQLLACMEKLSAELALKAVRSEKLFSQIIIHRMLVDSKSGDTDVGKLMMDFLSQRSTLTLCLVHPALLLAPVKRSSEKVRSSRTTPR